MQVAQTWTMLRIIYSSLGTVASTNLNHSMGKGSTALPLMNRYGGVRAAGSDEMSGITP